MLSFSRILSRSQPIKNQLIKASIAHFGAHGHHDHHHDLATQNGHPGVDVVIDSKDIRMQPLELNVEELTAKPNKTKYEVFVLKQVKKDASLLKLAKGPFMVKMREINNYNTQMRMFRRWVLALASATLLMLWISPRPLEGNADAHFRASIDAAPSAMHDVVILKKAVDYAKQPGATEAGWLEILAAHPLVSDEVRARSGAGNWISIVKSALKKPSDLPYVVQTPVVSADEVEELLAAHAAKIADLAAIQAAKEASKVVNATVIAQDQQ